MKKINRKRLELEREVLKALMAAIPTENLKGVQGGVETHSVIVPCSFSCVADACGPDG